MADLPFRETRDGVLLHVRLTPKAASDGIDGVALGSDGKPVLRARVRASPEAGAANAALIALLARSLGLPRSSLEVVSGAAARLKTIHVRGNAAMLGITLANVCDPDRRVR